MKLSERVSNFESINGLIPSVKLNKTIVRTFVENAKVISTVQSGGYNICYRITNAQSIDGTCTDFYLSKTGFLLSSFASKSLYTHQSRLFEYKSKSEATAALTKFGHSLDICTDSEIILAKDIYFSEENQDFKNVFLKYSKNYL